MDQSRQLTLEPVTLGFAFLVVVVTLFSLAPGASAAVRPDLQFVRMNGAPNPAYVGNDLTYTVEVTNKGPGEASGVLKTKVPSSVVFVSAQTSSGTCGTAINANSEVVCQLNKLLVGVPRKTTIKIVPVTGETTKLASATISLKEGGKIVNDSNQSNNSGELTDPFKDRGTEVRGKNCQQTDTRKGTPGDDSLTGTAGDDVICGLGGDDTINGMGGNDTIYGGADEDDIDAGDGDDIVRGGPNDDIITGGPGTDVVSYSDGLASRNVDLESLAQDPDPCTVSDDPDVKFEGNATDYRQDNRNSGMACDSLVDQIEGAIGSQFADRLTGSNENDTFWGLNGSDIIAGENGKDDTVAYSYCPRVDTPVGNDSSYNSCEDYGVTVDLSVVNAGQDTGEGYDTLKQFPSESTTPSIDNVIGSVSQDIIYGDDLDKPDDDLDNSIDGLGGNDRLYGLGGSDALTGGIGNDTLDTQDGVAGNDSANAGGGNDACNVDGGDTKVGCE